jgi:hypothetical protein
MNDNMKELITFIDILNDDIIDGIEKNLVEKIPLWKKAMVR